MRRIDVLREVVSSQYAAEALIVVNLGYPSRELYSLSDQDNIFYMLGSMGLASSIGMGLALVRKHDQVLVVDGDGSILMNLGTLASIANFAPKNFHLVIIDNHAHGSTGNQKGLTAMKTDLLKIAIGAGVGNAAKVETQNDLKRFLKDTLPTVLIVECTPFNAEVPIIPLTAVDIKSRFMKYVEAK